MENSSKDRSNKKLGLMDALKACMPDLAHYVVMHGPGPDRRMDALSEAIEEQGQIAAAAPELLEALKVLYGFNGLPCIDRLGNGDDCGDCPHCKARAAIAEAEGE